MKTLAKIALCALIPAAMLCGCAKKTVNSEKARQDYSRALDDSVSAIKQEIDSCRKQIKILNDQSAIWLRDFTNVSNPREVGSYLIYTSFRNRYPLTQTGLVARINDNGQFELIAALSGGRAFDQINVLGADGGLSSDVVPHDQALNYRSEGLTTVCFTGAKADSIGQLIADNELNPLTVNYLQGRAVSAWKIPNDYAKMLSATYLLYKYRKDATRLERRVPMLEQKVSLIKSHQEK